MSRRYVILGAGRQGIAAAYDLAIFGGATALTLLDRDPGIGQETASRLNTLLGKPIATAAGADAEQLSTVAPHLDGAAAMVSAAYYTFNLGITRLAIEKRVHLVDFGGNTGVVREQLALDAAARAAGITVVPDTGMGPGLNVSLGTYVMGTIEQPRDVFIWDGGLPQNPEPPWHYASTFNIGGLTNEYDGHAMFLRDGRVTPVACFTEVEELEFPAPIGRLEGFVTSGGLSTAPWTFEGKLQRLENKTLRYPGHVAQFRAFVDLGLLRLDPVVIAGHPVVPRDVLHALLGPQITKAQVKDVCVMRVTCRGTTAGRRAESTVEVIDRYDDRTGFTAMQRLTGWHGSLMLIAAVEGRIRRGAVSMEVALRGAEVVAEERRRGITITEKLTTP